MDKLLELKWIYRLKDDSQYILDPFFILKSQYFKNIIDLQEKITTELGPLSLFELDNVEYNESFHSIHKYIFDFANKVGGIFIHLALFCMDERNEISNEYTEDRDLFALKWIKDIIAELTSGWIEEFRGMMHESLASYYRDILKENNNIILSNDNYMKIKNEINSQNNINKYLLDVNKSDILFNILNDIYPQIFEAFNDIKKQTLQDSKQSNEKKLYQIFKELTSQMCTHEFIRIPEFLRPYPNSPFTKHCKRCHKSFR